MRILFLLIFVLLSALPAQAATASLADVQAAVIQQDYKAANQLAKELLTQRLPREQAQEAEYYLGLSYLRLADYQKAWETFKKLLSERPASGLYDKVAIGTIDVLYLQGQYEPALKEAMALMSKHPDSDLMSLIYLKAARANLKLARWNKAREFLQKIGAEYPDSFEANIARGLLEEKQYFAVQVGAFTDRARAERLMKELLERKEYSYIVETKSAEGRMYYRVRVGQLTAFKDAQELEKKLSGLGYPTLIYP